MRKNLMKNILAACIVSLSFIASVSAQDYNIGVRAGLNYATMTGAEEAGETLGYAQGIHFGLNFSWNFSDLFALRSELLYVQNGTTKKYEGPSYYVFRLTSGNVYDEGYAKYTLDISNSYISFPVTGHLKISKKFEAFGGAYIGFLVSPKGAGKLDYESTIDPDNIFFIQSQDYSYYSDEAGGGNFFVTPIELDINDVVYSLASNVGAYYQFDVLETKLFNRVDYGLILGGSYYFNPGFYSSLRMNYGFRDLTRTITDVSLVSLNSAGGFVPRDDNDANLSFELSIGFKF